MGMRHGSLSVHNNIPYLSSASREGLSISTVEGRVCKSVGGSLQGKGMSDAVVLSELEVGADVDVAVAGREVVGGKEEKVIEETEREEGCLTKRTK